MTIFFSIKNVCHIRCFYDHNVGATHASPLRKPRGPQRQSVGAIIGAFKSAPTKRANEMRRESGMSLWQRDYHERVIRDEYELNRIREYIAANPARWAEDVNNPARSWVVVSK
jgi:REP-associated tyrosine transposase